MADALEGAKPLDSSSDVLSDAKPIPPPSVMDPNKGTDTLKRIGRTIGQYDPSNPANMGRVAPLAAGAAMSGAGLATDEPGLVKIGLSVAGGTLSPWAEYAASKALGGHPDLPDWKDSVRSGILNGMFEMSAGKSEAFRTGATATKSEIAALPEELRTPANIKAAVRNRDFLKKLGMNDQQIDEAIKDPDDIAAALQRSMNQGRQIQDTFDKTVSGERARFQQRFDTGYGEQKTATTPIDDLAKSFQQLAQGGGEHELTPAYKSFLERKSKELAPPEPPVMDPTVKTDLGRKLDPKNPSDARLIEAMRKQGGVPAPVPPKSMAVEDLAKLRTEMRENVPANPTNLDKKAAAAIDAQITSKWKQTLMANGATNEQIGRLEGTYQDYADFQKTISGLRPGSKEFGEQTADAFFKTAKQNPTLALNFVKMAEDSGNLPEFRESFLKQITQDMRGVGGGPNKQAEMLYKLQTEWRGTNDGKAVLRSVFGKNSPMADPTEFSKVIGAAGNPKSLAGATSIVSNYIRSPEFIVRLGTFYATYSLIVGSGSSPWSDMRKDPERAMTGLAGAMLTLGGINKIMAHVSPPVQRSYANWLTSGSPDSFANLLRLTGSTTTALTSQPSTTVGETPTR